MRLLRQSVLGLAALVVQALPVAAEDLIPTIAPEVISISSSYSGGSIVAFGAIEGGKAPARAYDVIVTVTGPRQSVVSRRKERVAGIWLNKSSRTFNNIPAFLGVFANRPLDAIASADTLHEHRIGLRNAIFTPPNGDESDLFLKNLIDVRVDENLYSEQPKAVTFLSPTAFRLEIPLPQSVVVGNYNVDFRLYSNGIQLARKLATFKVAKVGIEALVIKASTDFSLLYGLATTLTALLMGWMALIVFRKD